MELVLFIVAVVVFYMLSKNLQNFKGATFEQPQGNADKETYKRHGNKPFAASTQEIANTEYGLIVALIAKVAKADGRVSELEAELIGNALDDLSVDYVNSKEARGYLKEIFNRNKESTNLEYILNNLYAIIYNDYDKRVKIVEFLLNIAFIDGHLDEREAVMMREIASGLKIKNEDYERFFASFNSYYKERSAQPRQDTKLESAYSLLKADKNDSDEEIKRKYKEALKKYHPDIIRGKGLEEDFVELATKKLQEINGAYESIKKARGI